LLETGDVVVRIADQVGVARAAHRKPFLEPEVEYVVQVDIAQHGRDQAPLRGAFVTRRKRPVFHDAGLQKAPHDPQEIWIGDAVFQEAH
jgi:hypothetical protein